MMFHIIPRFEGDALQMWHGKEYENAQEMEGVAEKIKENL